MVLKESNKVFDMMHKLLYLKQSSVSRGHDTMVVECVKLHTHSFIGEMIINI